MNIASIYLESIRIIITVSGYDSYDNVGEYL